MARFSRRSGRIGWAGRSGRTGLPGAWIAVLLIALGAQGAQAQGFMIKPMIFELAARPGDRLEPVLEIRNSTERPIRVRSGALELGQGNNGSWTVHEPHEGSRGSSPRSCLGWLHDPESEVTIPGLQTHRFGLHLDVPLSAHGFYGAALIVENVPPTRDDALSLVVRFLVPVLIHVRGTTAHRQVTCHDARLRCEPATEATPAGTHLVLDVANEGETLALLGGGAMLFYLAGGRWTRVTEVALEEIRVIPGASFPLTRDVERCLPGGRYRVDLRLTADGQPMPTMTHEMDFAGDPHAGALAADVDLLLDPMLVSVRGTQGASRRRVVTVHNPSAESLRVACSISAPPSLQGVMLGETRGEQLSCCGWTEVEPREVVLRPGGRERLTLRVDYPNEPGSPPCTYAVLHVTAHYTDGQSAGGRDLLVVAEDMRQGAEARLQAGGLSLAHINGTTFGVVATVANTGEIHVDPDAFAALTSASGTRTLTTIELNRAPGPILPLQTVRFGGEVDFASVPVGLYVLGAVVSHGEQVVEQKLPIRVKDGTGGRAVEILEALQ